METQGSVEASSGGWPLVSRRTVAIGAAWSVPVILGVAATPAAAASLTPGTGGGGNPIVQASLVGSKQAQHPFGVKHIDFTLTLSNSGTAAANIQVLNVVSDDVKAGTTPTMTGLPTAMTLAPAASSTVAFSLQYEGSAGTANYTASYTVDGVAASATVRV